MYIYHLPVKCNVSIVLVNVYDQLLFLRKQEKNKPFCSVSEKCGTGLF